MSNFAKKRMNIHSFFKNSRNVQKVAGLCVNEKSHKPVKEFIASKLDEKVLHSTLRIVQLCRPWTR